MSIARSVNAYRYDEILSNDISRKIVKFEKKVKSPLGDPVNPMSMNMIENKIHLIADKLAFPHIASRIVESVKQLESSDICGLSNTLGNKPDSRPSNKKKIKSHRTKEIK